MTEKNENKIQLIDLDLEQWRRDINTFATATQQALDAIADELSNTCNGGQGAPVQSTAEKVSTNRKFTRKATTNHESKTDQTNSKPADISKTSFGNDRLATIKEKLAQRLATNKCSTT